MVFYKICIDFIRENQPLLYSHFIIIIIFFGLAAGFIPWVMNRVKDIKSKHDLKDFVFKIVLFALLFLPIFLSKMYTQSILFPRWNKYVRSKLFELYLDKNKVEFKESDVSADIVTLFEVSEQTSLIFNWVATIFVPVIVSIVCMNIYLYFINPVIGTFCTCTTILIIYYLLSNISYVSDMYLQKHIHYKNMLSTLDNTYTNLFNVYLNNKTKDTVENNFKIEQHYESKINSHTFNLLRFALVLRFISYLFIVFTLSYIYYKSKDELPDQFYTIITFLIFYVSRVDELTESVPLYISKIAGLRLHEPLFQTRSITYEPFNEIQGDIKFDNVSFGYNDMITIHKFNMDVKRGQRIGIIGETGTGKTTLMKLLLNFYKPSEGTIYIDGKDLKTIDPEYVRKSMYYINQRTMLFNDTLLNNLRYGTSFTEQEVSDFVRKYDLESVFNQSGEDWLNTMVETNGSNISLGMQKVIFLVRGLLHKAPIYLIDEPFTSIDENSRAKVLRLLDEETKGKTVLIITHDQNGLDKMLDSFVLLKKSKNES